MVEGEEGVEAEKIDRDFWRVGSEKEGEEVGLRGEDGRAGGVVEVGRGGKSTREEKEGTVGEGIGFGMGGGGKPSKGACAQTKGGEEGLAGETEGGEGTNVSLIG